MPSAIMPEPGNGITKFTNCRILRGDSLVNEDLWVSSKTGMIVRSQSAFFDQLVLPDQTIDLGGRILAPGFIECQLNGAFGFNFSTLMEDRSQYGKKVREVNRQLVKTGVTSYIPTITSQTSELYHAVSLVPYGQLPSCGQSTEQLLTREIWPKVLPFLGPSGHLQVAEDGAESLGAHVEGPFLSPTKNGVHSRDVLREAQEFKDLEDMYGATNLNPSASGLPAPVKMITAAPERGQMANIIPEIRSRGIIYSVGHSESTYEEASAAVAKGATMITHLFNAMRPLHHRNPGIFGVLGNTESASRPFYGVISDGIHLHPTTVKIAWNAHSEGFILVTDAMHLVGLPDGSYQWRNGDKVNRIVKKGSTLHLEGSDTIAGR